MRAETMAFVEVCEANDLWVGEMLDFEVGGRPVIVVNVEGTFHAYDGRCPHQGVPLAKGSLEGGKLTCRAHQWEFDVCTGHSINPIGECLVRHPVKIEDGKVLIGEQVESAARTARTKERQDDSIEHSCDAAQ